MLDLEHFTQPIKYLFFDIDDTITEHGQLHGDAYLALWKLKDANIKLVPVTGRPAGWCELIARLWPVEGVIGENGGFYFSLKSGKMSRYYFQDEKIRESNRLKLNIIKEEILKSVSGAAIASDQFCRQLDLAIDFCEDVQALNRVQVQKIVDIFTHHGAQAKVSSIHVNGWFGAHNKLEMCKEFSRIELGLNLQKPEDLKVCAFVGDSPNDEPMFEFFPNSFAVQNINEFIDELTFKPQYVTPSPFGKGFTELSIRLLQLTK